MIWLTGLSGAGKSTIADALACLVKPHIPGLVLIDGDTIRDLFGAGLGFDEDSRKLQIGRIQRLALFLTRQEIPLIVAALYSHPELMQWNRENLPGYFEVYVDTPLAIVIARDTKGLYAKSQGGELLNVVGVDIPWHVPSNPDMVLRTVGSTPASLARSVVEAVPLLRSLNLPNLE